MSGVVRKGGRTNQSAAIEMLARDASGNVIGLLGQAGNVVRLALPQATRPIIVCIGDSTMAYSHALTGSALSLVYNGDGTATITFAAPQGIAKGDLIGVQGCLNDAYEVRETPVLAVAGSAYTYALNPGTVPSVSPDGGTEIAIRYANRASAAGPMTAINALTGRNLRFINCGQIGDTITRLIERFDVDIAPFAAGNRILLTIGINDAFGKGLSLSQMQASMLILWDKCRAIDAKLDILTPFPQLDTRKNWSIARRDVFIGFRRWLMRWALDNGLICVDWASCAAGGVQVQDPISANGNPAANMVRDDKVHPLTSACWLAAEPLATIYNTLFQTGPTLGAAKNITDCGLLSCGLFTGTSGTAANGTGTVTGVVAAGVTITMVAGTGTATCYLTPRSYTAEGDAAGFWQGVSLNAAAAGDQVQIKLQNLLPLVTNGDVIRIKGLARIVSGPSLIKEFSFLCNSQTATSGNLLVTDMQAGTTQMAPFAKNFTMTLGADVPLRGPASVHGAPTNCVPTIQFTAASAGTMAVEVACWSAEKP